MAKITRDENTETQIRTIDDQRRRLGIASLHGKVKACIHLLKLADTVCGEAMDSYSDPNQSDGHLYTCLEAIHTALTEVKEHTNVGSALCEQIVGDKTIPPLATFTNQMIRYNETPQPA